MPESGAVRIPAANLQIQAETSRTRLTQKAGEITQRERMRQLLGDESGADEWAEQIKSIMDQYDEQVILKEVVAAELDCRFARRAIQDILGAERQRQLLGADHAVDDGVNSTSLRKKAGPRGNDDRLSVRI